MSSSLLLLIFADFLLFVFLPLCQFTLVWRLRQIDPFYILSRGKIVQENNVFSPRLRGLGLFSVKSLVGKKQDY